MRKSAHDLYKCLPVPGGPLEAECERYWRAIPAPEEIEPIVRRLKALRFTA